MSGRRALKALLQPARRAAGRFVVAGEPLTSRIIYKAAEITSSEHVEGDYLEFGVFRGSTFSQAYQTIRDSYLERARDRTRIHSPAHRDSVREIWRRMRFFAFDSFQGLPHASGPDGLTRDFEAGKFACSADEFRANITRRGVTLDKVVVVPGWFAETCTPDTRERHAMRSASIVHIDCDLYESAKVVLPFIEPLLVDGTVLICDDWYSFRGHPNLGEQRAFREWTQRLSGWTLSEYQKEGPWRNSFIASRDLA